jgi:hypothetical protein
MTESKTLPSRVLEKLRAAGDARRIAAGWTILALLALIMQYGPVRECPKWGICEKGALVSGLAPFLITLLIWAAGIALLAFGRTPSAESPARIDDLARPPRRRHGVILVFCALSTLAMAHLFLLSPPIPKPFWAYPIRLSPHLGFPLNWDSPLFMDLALSPGKLLQAGSVSLPQNRPLYVWITAGLTRVVSPLARAVGIEGMYGVPHPAFFPGIVLNWILLSLALFMFWRLLSDLGGRYSRYVAVLCAVPLLANDIVKAFVWTLHQQIFNLLVPVLGIWICRSIFEGSSFSNGKTLLLGLGLGVSSLAYESFVFIVPAIAGALLLQARPVNAREWWRQGVRVGFLSLGFALPHLAWMALIFARTGAFHRAPFETDRDFVWLIDSLRVGGGAAATRMFSYLILFLRTTWAACGPLIALAVVLVFIRHALGLTWSPQSPIRRATQRAAGCTLLSALILLFWMGQYLERYSFFVGPILLVLCGLWLTEVMESSGRAIRLAIYGSLAAADVLWLFFQVAKYGPYS